MIDLDLVKIGRLALLIGLILSILPAFVSMTFSPVLLYLLGLVVGLLHITDKESTSFLVALIALIVIGVSTIELGVFTGIFVLVLTNIVAFLSSAGLIVSLKLLFGIIKE